MSSPGRLGAAIVILCGMGAGATARGQGVLPPKKGTFTEFESGQVRPLALSADHQWLYAVNTPDSRLEILRVTGAGLTPISSVVVGLEPVAVAVRGDAEVWVVNHLSDSI